MSWLSVTEIKRVIGEAGADRDDQLSALADAACRLVEDYTEQRFGRTFDVTERFDGGCRSIILAADAVDIVTITDTFTGEVITDFILEPATGILRLQGVYFERQWPAGFRRWEITYRRGVEPSYAVQLAASKIVEMMLRDTSITSEKDGDYSYARGNADKGYFTPEIQQLLRNQRRRRLIA